MELNLEVIQREVIKPSSPAPHDRLQLSVIDFGIAEACVPMIFFYNLADLAEKSPDIVSTRLRSSLSQALSRFYPLAGKKEGVSISCNDEGAVFTEARTNLLLSEFLRNIDINSLKILIPTLAPGESLDSRPLLSVQATFFGSGSGVAVGICVSHCICDAASVSTFVRGWAATARGDSNDELSTPQFAEVAIHPPADISIHGSPFNALSEVREKCVTNRFVFESDKITKLKIVAASKSVPSPTRVEAVMSLIWRCARNASHANLIVPRATMMTQSMDLRLRIPTNVLSPDAIGNLQGVFFLKRGPGSEIEISEVVAEFRKEKEEFNEMIKENVNGGHTNTTLGQKIMSGIANYMSELKPNIDTYTMSSWCRKAFYEVDFGWGRPAWVGLGHQDIQDGVMYVLLVDAKDGEGVEAWVGIPEQDMAAFVCDQELLSYASLNPPVLI
ncbi:BAHD acyltransferase [Arabidopsis thaliana]|uniref:Uncharacterized protein n=2 Tax=Arabidopsis TaxID=3701 RepID=A0A178UCH6_ARATH|nr:Transferase [Arabidopsis thaliana x Arabidopsis arenosa]OAO90812.1 hypothetical protein AXX17_AT5G46490 [Arabidopsis thaliana]VYS69650.1 unnamed protein product [Arabidopsis thaliana]